MNNIMLESEDLLDNELLSRFDLLDYDIDRTYYRVYKFMKDYRRLKSKSYSNIPIKITTKYKYIFVDESVHNINEYTNIDKYIDDDDEYRKLSMQICLITEKFSQEELAYYTICLYQQRPESRAYKEIGCSNHGLVPIKNSCIVKFACALNIEVNKYDGFNNDIEEKEYQNFMELVRM